MSYCNIAIDGPSGAGKSTIARILAQRFGMTYVDTGAIYRAIALYMHNLGIDCSDASAVIAHLPEIEVSIEYGEEGQRVLLCGEDVSKEIRRHEISECTSQVSVIPQVRQFLMELQRGLAKTRDCIMDGRDIGTVVFPDAELKIFLTASPEVRARRRVDELRAKGQEVSFDEVLHNVKERDRIDETRSVDPLRRADDAILLDNSYMTLAQQDAWLMQQYRRAAGLEKEE